MKNKNKQEPLKSIFAGAATGAIGGLIFGSSVEFLTDVLGRASFSLPELMFNGFLLGLIPAATVTGGAYLGTKVLSKENTLHTYAATHLIAVALATSVALTNDIGSFDDRSSFINTGQSSSTQLYKLNGLTTLLRAFNF